MVDRKSRILLRFFCMLACMCCYVVNAYTTGSNVMKQAISTSSSSFSLSSGLPEVRIPWLIVGGGIHGVHIAARLVGEQSNDPSRMVIVDDNHELLQKWKSRTAATGMTYLRSSGGYHLDLDEHSLRRQLGGNIGIGKTKIKGKKKRGKQKRQQNVNDNNMAFTKDYERPRLDLFNQHCDSVIEKYGLQDMHVRGTVTKIEPMEDFVMVVVSSPSATSARGNENDCMDFVIYHAEHVVLALGNDTPSYADWVQDDDVSKGRIRHLLDDTVSDHGDGQELDVEGSLDVMHKQSIAVIGGGITAAHKALELVTKNNNPQRTNGSNPKSAIHLISRHELREQQFDTHQDWMMDRKACERSENSGGYGMPSRQRKFAAMTSWQERRKTIARERIPGTVTPAVYRGEDGLRYAFERGDVKFHAAEVIEKRNIQSHVNRNREQMELELSTGEIIVVDKVLLATGFGKRLPGGSLIQKDLVEDAGLAVSDFCGFPIVDEDLRWHPRIFVAGALAELELGPSARNIAGARMAAERIVNSSKQK